MAKVLRPPPPPPDQQKLLDVFRRNVPTDYYTPIAEGEPGGTPHPSFALFRGMARTFETAAQKGTRSTAARYHLPSALQRDLPASSGRPAGVGDGLVTISRVGPSSDALIIDPGRMRLVFDGGPTLLEQGAREYVNVSRVVWEPGDTADRTVRFVCDALGYTGNVDFLRDEATGLVDLDLVTIKDQDTARSNVGGTIIAGPQTIVQDSGTPSIFIPEDVGLYVRIDNAINPANIGKVRRIVGFDSPEVEFPVGTGRYPRQVFVEDVIPRNTVEVLQDDGGVFTDYDAQARVEAGTNDVPVLPDPFVVGDALYLGFTKTFQGTRIRLDTAGVGDWGVVFEYWNGATWGALPNVDDVTNGLRPDAGDGTYEITWDIPPDWATLASPSGSGLSLLFVRMRVDTLTLLTTAPIAGRIVLLSSEPLVADSQVKWTLLDFQEADLGLSLVSVEAFSGGRDDDLYILGDNRGVYRQDGEDDDVFRDRVSRLADVVSPNAIIKAVNRILRPLGFTGGACDVQPGGIASGFDGLFLDVDATLAPDFVSALDLYGAGDLFPTKHYFVLQSAQEAYGWFLVKVPYMGAGDFGIYLDEGPIYFDDTVGVYYGPASTGWLDGYPIDASATYAAIYAAVDAIRMGGVGFTLVRREDLSVPGSC